jgi:hypothetical protein
VDRHPARSAFHGLARARQRIQRLALVLERRIHRRHLLDLAAKARQRPSSCGASTVDRQAVP